MSRVAKIDRGGDPEVDPESGEEIPGVPVMFVGVRVDESLRGDVDVDQQLDILRLDTGEALSADESDLGDGDRFVFFLEHVSAPETPGILTVDGFYNTVGGEDGRLRDSGRTRSQPRRGDCFVGRGRLDRLGTGLPPASVRVRYDGPSCVRGVATPADGVGPVGAAIASCASPQRTANPTSRIEHRIARSSARVRCTRRQGGAAHRQRRSGITGPISAARRGAGWFGVTTHAPSSRYPHRHTFQGAAPSGRRRPCRVGRCSGGVVGQCLGDRATRHSRSVAEHC